MAGIKTSIDPAIMPALDNGTVISQKVLNGLVPRSAAASKKRTSNLDKLAYKGNIINGKYEYTIPMMSENGEFIIVIGSLIAPILINALLIMPLLTSKIFQA